MNSTISEKNSDQLILDAVCTNFGAILDAKQEVENPLLPHSKLKTAFQLLGKLNKIKFVFPKPSSDANVDDAIDRIARMSGTHYRYIGLKSLLSSHTPIPLLAFYGKDKVPVVLQLKKEGCFLLDPKTQKATRLTAQEMEQLHDEVYQFYWPFSDVADLSFFSMLRLLIKRYWQEFKLALGSGFLIVLASLAFPFANKILFDEVLDTGDIPYFIQVTLGLAVIIISSLLFMLTERFTISRMRTLILHDLQTGIWGSILSSSAKILKKFTVGEIFERIDYFERNHQILGEQAIATILNTTFAIFYLGVMFLFNPPFTLGSLFIILMAFLIAIPILRLFLQLERQYLLLENKLVSKVIQFIRGILTIRTTRSQHRFFASWANTFIPTQKLKKEMGFVGIAFSCIVSLTPLLVTLLVYSIAVYYIETEAPHFRFSLGSYLAFFAALTIFIHSSFTALNYFFEAVSIIPSWQQVQQLFTEKEKIVVADAFLPLKGDIEIEDLHFSYHQDSPMILKGINLRVKQGEFIGVVGPTGCGKSTLLRLLIGLEKPIKGEVKYDEKSLAQWDLIDLRSQIGCVLQNSTIFDGSLLENIVAGRRIEQKQIDEVIKQAGLEEFIAELPMGLHTHVSYGGVTISLGQKQRILIARALVNKPRVILFDEATSAQDNISQKLITENLEKLKITRVVIAHRRTTIKNADCIYTLKDGILVKE